ncbi:hypothetical protein, partial [Schlesneria sp.]|uniref:hypothetical protein n=1 Tax=Schlesneria sp. TaxID=2762018 RepID=UPI002F094F68
MIEPADAIDAEIRQDSDYNGAWKEAFRLHLREFIEKCFSRLALLIDWSRAPVWLDKEISQIVGQSGHRNREVDLLFKVWLIEGGEQWIFCHLEIQTNYEANFDFRIDLYNSGLKWLFQRDVLTLVLLTDVNPDWRPEKYQFELGGFVSNRLFPMCKVLDRLATDWKDDRSLVVEVSRAQIAALRTSRDPQARYNAKTQLVRNLYTAGYDADQIREIFRLIDWMMHLRLDLSRQFNEELIAYEKELQMPYVTSIERHAEQRGLELGLERGLKKGLERGSTRILMRILSRICGDVPEEIQAKIEALSLEQR